MALPIEDYALIGDSRTAALVGRDGSIDWLCLPRFDSHACFAALLGTPGNGRWLIGPAGPAETTRRYLPHSSVLETTHTTATGSFRVVDAMPIGDQRADVVRRVEGLSGTVTVRHEWIVRLGYGHIKPWVTRVSARRRRRDRRGRRTGPPGAARASPAARRGRPARRRVRARTQASRWSSPRPGRRRTAGSCTAATWTSGVDATVAPEQAVGRPLHLRRSLPRGRGPVGAHAADAHARGDRRHRRGAHDQPAGGLRRRAQLGLPVQLAPRRLPDHRRAAAVRLPRRDPVVAGLAAAGGGRRPRRPADHVRRRRRPRPPRARAVVPARVRRLATGPDRQRGRGPGAERRPRRGDVGAAPGPRQRRRRRAGLVGDAGGAPPRAGQALAGTGPRPLGDPWPAPALHALPGHGVGRLRPGRAWQWRSTGSRGRWRGGASCATRSATRCSRHGVDRKRNTFTQHYDTTEVDASLLVLGGCGFIAGDDP